MRAALNLLPLAAFALAYHYGGIYVATAVLMGAMVLLVAIDYLQQGRVAPLHAFTAALVLVFGTLTLVLHDPRFLKLKPSILLWSIALAFLGSQWIGHQTLAQRMFAGTLPEHSSLSARLWARVNLLWVLVYLLLGALNLYIAHRASEQSWVHFKVYGLTVILVVLAMVQALWLQRRSTTP
jgi:intracellular septation protein